MFLRAPLAFCAERSHEGPVSDGAVAESPETIAQRSMGYTEKCVDGAANHRRRAESWRTVGWPNYARINASLCRSGVTRQSFLMGKGDCVTENHRSIRQRLHSNPCSHADEGQHTQPTGVAGGAARWEHVIGTGPIVTKHLRRP